VFIDEREVLDVLDLMRTAIPDEIKQARRINQERDKVLAQAQTEANRLVTQAQERVERMVTEDNVRVMAEERAHEVVTQARNDASDIRDDADHYVMDMLHRLDAELKRVHGSVQNAMDAMEAREPAAVVDEDEPE